MEQENIYQQNGFDSRADYLQYLADENNITYDEVYSLSLLLGRGEDFDGLVNACEDFSGVNDDYDGLLQEHE